MAVLVHMAGAGMVVELAAVVNVLICCGIRPSRRLRIGRRFGCVGWSGGLVIFEALHCLFGRMCLLALRLGRG